MRERPILFRGRLVRQILAGRKTQTRRIVKWETADVPQPVALVRVPLQFTFLYLDAQLGLAWIPYSGAGLQPWPVERIGEVCPYGGAGDRLWVKETFSLDALTVYPCPPVWYRADVVSKYDDPAHGEHVSGCKGPKDGRRYADCFACALDGGRFRWRPSIFMPRALSRITLEVTQVRVERLQSITDEDILAEGCTIEVASEVTGVPRSSIPTLRDAWRELWSHVNGPASWDANPWVWAIFFRQVASRAEALPRAG